MYIYIYKVYIYIYIYKIHIYKYILKYILMYMLKMCLSFLGLYVQNLVLKMLTIS